MTSPISLRRVRRPLTERLTPAPTDLTDGTDAAVASGAAVGSGAGDDTEAVGDAALAGVDARLKSIADPTRLRILNLLASGELCVCDVVDILALPQPTVSRHLGQLRRSGLVAATREWKFAHYRLSPARDAVHASILACVDAAMRTVPSLASERSEAARHAAERARLPCA